MQPNFYVKSHGLGNEYVVLDNTNITATITKEFIIKICDIHYGIGTDGVLLKVPSMKADFGLKIYNPDGSEAEKSGNGLRIFCKYLYDYGFTDSDSFTVETLGGLVTAVVLESKFGKAQLIKIDMGKAQFETRNIPAIFDKPEIIKEKLIVGDKEFSICCVSVGNPHCVVLSENFDEAMVRKYGPLIENHPMFPNRINVQFAKVISESSVQIQIWERGAGYTLASGSSSCAVACVTRKLGLVGKNVKVIMPGGTLDIVVEDSWEIKMAGPVREIASGILSNEFLEDCK